MRPSEQCKAAGLKSLAELAKITGESVQTLNNWSKNKPILFATVLDGALASKGIFKMKHTLNASSVVGDYTRRGIDPDKVEYVDNGILLMWLFNNSYICELRVGAKSLEKQPGEWAVTGGAYINTYSAQEIADDLGRKIGKA